LGLDATNTRLFLVVVDGRQPGYSEGVALHELAAHMIELGCRSAVNLDGGGSSIMILAGRDGKLSVVNDPSTKQNGVSLPRPIPVALAIVPKMGGQE
jgi:exopolysaccharide biosynthesis protein